MKSIQKVLIILSLGVLAQLLVYARNTSFTDYSAFHSIPTTIAAFIGGLLAGLLAALVLSSIYWLIKRFKKDKMWDIFYKANLCFWVFYILLQGYYLSQGI